MNKRIFIIIALQYTCQEKLLRKEILPAFLTDRLVLPLYTQRNHSPCPSNNSLPAASLGVPYLRFQTTGRFGSQLTGKNNPTETRVRGREEGEREGGGREGEEGGRGERERERGERGGGERERETEGGWR